METNLGFRSPVSEMQEGNTGVPRENLRKQVWTRNQMHIWHRDWESNPCPLVHSAGEESLRYLLMLIFIGRFNPLNPGQFTPRCTAYPDRSAITYQYQYQYWLFWQRKCPAITAFHLLPYLLLTNRYHVFLRFCLKIRFVDYITPLHCP